MREVKVNLVLLTIVCNPDVGNVVWLERLRDVRLEREL
jgi:hypothetical protein